MNKQIKRISIYLVILMLLNISVNSVIFAQTKAKKSNTISRDKIEQMIHKEFGSKIEVVKEKEYYLLEYYLLGDFNGDGKSDIAVLVKPHKAKDQLTNHNVKYLSVNSFSSKNGSQMDPIKEMEEDHLVVAIAHGGVGGWTTVVTEKYMFYGSFLTFQLVPKGTKIRRGRASEGRTPVPKGDSIFLELETAGTRIVYWNGKTYRGFGQQQGD
jgi:hypothetical protein